MRNLGNGKPGFGQVQRRPLHPSLHDESLRRRLEAVFEQRVKTALTDPNFARNPFHGERIREMGLDERDGFRQRATRFLRRQAGRAFQRLVPATSARTPGPFRIRLSRMTVSQKPRSDSSNATNGTSPAADQSAPSASSVRIGEGRLTIRNALSADPANPCFCPAGIAAARKSLTSPSRSSTTISSVPRIGSTI